MIRTPLAPESEVVPPRQVCANPLCGAVLTEKTPVVILRGMAYCSPQCRKTWPPTIQKIQKYYRAPVDLVLEIAMMVFKSKRRVGEVLELGIPTVERLLDIYGISTNGRNPKSCVPKREAV
jgi:hypothetical protein